MKRSYPLLIVVCFTVFAFLAAFTAKAGNVTLRERFSPSRVIESLARLNPLRTVPDEPARRMPDALAKSQAQNKPRILFAQAAAPIVVNDTSDATDADNTDNACDTNLAIRGSQCSLRAAIQQSNTSVDANTINFNIPGGGVQIISPTSALPVIGNPVTINGYTQPGAATNTSFFGGLNTTLTIVLDGTAAGSGVSGLTINGASNCAIRGLNIRNFASNGMVMTNTATSNTVTGCFIGTNVTGTAAAPNGGDGIQLSSVIGNTIGGLTAADKNLISGNGGTGIRDLGDGTASAVGNTIQGNVIGLNAATTGKVANKIGIEINSRDSTIVGSPATGGILTGASNIISGNTNQGISILNFIAGADNISIRGNDIGTNNSDATGLGNGTDGIFIGGVGDQILSNTIIGNGRFGVHLFNATSVVIQQNNLGFATNGNVGSGVFLSNGAKNNIIGGAVGDSFATAEANGNLIAGNLTGVSVDSGGDDATGNSIRGNTIEKNTFLGINLNGNGNSGDGVTPNDTDDPDVGDNLLQNSPVITSVVGSATVNFTLNSTPNTTFVIDFYDNNTTSQALAEGSAGLGSVTVRTDASGDVQSVFNAAGISGFVSATATDPAGNTSEFSSGVRAVQTFTVNTTASDDDGACNTLGAGLDCTIREAINAVNAGSGNDTIAFNIGGGIGLKTIAPTSALPAITKPVTIDGYTQPGATANTLATGNNAVLLIELNGAAAGTTTNGLTLSADGITVRGLVINRFSTNGISINQGAGSSRDTIAGCFIGTNAAGTADLGNGSGILLGGFNSVGKNTIGGVTPQARNVISGNGNGIEVISSDNVIVGNYIGLSATGTIALGNTSQGIALFSPAITGNIIGGTTAASRNVISSNAIGIRVTGDGTVVQGNYIGLDAAGAAARGNTTAGIQFNFFAGNSIIGGLTTTTGAAPGNVISSNGVGIDCPSSAPATGSLIRGNLIGTDAGGTLNRGNTGTGISIGTNGITVGGTVADAANKIVFNGGDGIEISSGTGNAIRRNSILINIGLGIDLNADGVSVNDGAPDSDAGANGTQNFPVITDVTQNGTNTVVSATLNTAPGSYAIELFRNTARDATGNGEGETFVATQNVTVPSGAALNFTFTVGGTVNDFFSMTATRNSAPLDTSEFSNAVRAPRNFVVDTTSNNPALSACTAAPNDCSLPGAVAAANANSGTDTISFAISGTGVQTITPGFLSLRITDPVTIDGFTQPGSAANTNLINQAVNAKPLIQVQGEQFDIQAGGIGSTIRGLIINGANGGGVTIEAGANNCTIQGCFIGTDALGNDAGAQAINGDCVEINSTGNLIGGTTAAARNVIGDSNGSAVNIRATTANSNTIQGNFLQVNAAGTNTLHANGGSVNILSSNNTIGGTAAQARNVMSAGNGSAVSIQGSNNQILRNSMGTNPAGTAALTLPTGANNSGVILLNGTGNKIGDGTAANGNIIAFNSDFGVAVLNTTLGGVPTNPKNNSIRANSIFSNGGLGIDLVTPGGQFNVATPNDTGDGDAGPNNLQNYPVITSVSSTTISGTLNSAASTTFTLDFYDNSTADPSGNGEGATFLGSRNVTTNTSGNANFTFTTGTSPTNLVTATATDPADNTSEFSATLLAPQNFVVDTTSDANLTACTAAAGDCSLRGAINNANANAGATIRFNIPTSDPNFSGGVFTIKPNSQLPSITANGTIIDGSTQTAFTGNTNTAGPEVVIDGSTAPTGFEIKASNCVIRGFVINGFNVSGLPDAIVLENAATGCRIEGNYIGTDASGTTAVANGFGIFLRDGAHDNIIGGTAAGAGNTIAFNTSQGVLVDGSAGTGNAIRGNSIFSNGKLGIDLSQSSGLGDGVTANDNLDPDTGPNNLQNFPVITGVTFSGGNTIISATLNSAPGTYAIDLFSNTAADSSGNGEGETFLATQNVTVPAGGTSINFSFTVTGLVNDFFSMMATRNAAPLDSSEFSNAMRALPTLSINDVTAPEGTNAIATFTVALSAASAQTITVDFATANNTANAPGDYTAQNNTLTFTPGQSAKAITVRLQEDALDEPAEKYFVNLTNPTNATISDAQGVGTITDNDAAPTLSIGNAAIVEPDTGSVNLLFPVTLSAASGKTVSVNFQTQDGTATAPADYTAQTGTLNFAPGETSKTVSVPVIGETIIEPNETFFVNLNTPTNSTIADGQGLGTITNDDTAPATNLVVDTVSDANLTACTMAPNDCSLRGAINNANLRAGADTITFNIPGTGVKTIAPLTVLPAITGLGTVIDGYSQPGSKPNSLTVGNNATLLIELNGAAINSHGLNVTASNTVITGLIINRFGAGIGGDGIALTGNNNQVAGCFIGTNATGTGALPNVGSGISVFGDSNRIGGSNASERNVISGNKFNGVHIRANATGILVRGNYLGTNATGAAPLGNASVGILIEGDTNTVGGDTVAARNVLSGNGIHGIAISGGTGNSVRGNYVGTSANGNTDVGNTRTGVRLEANATNNTIGGTIAGSHNLISGNDGAGVVLTAAGTSSNTVQGNFIGTNASGLTALPNLTGVFIAAGAQINTIGGTAAGTRNLISGNTLSGIEINASNNNRIEGNTIGLNANGAALGNGAFGDGIQLNAGAKGNIVGGTVTGARNIISGNTGTAVSIDGSSTNQVRGNYIGTNSTGNAAIANGRGVRLSNGATGNIIGGTTAAFRNVISGCEYGVEMVDATTSGNAVLGNYLGTNAAGSAALSNRFGVAIGGASRNTIGGTQSGARNLISGNKDANVYIAEGAAGNSVVGNFIGTTLNGAGSMGAFSTTAGVWIDNGANGNVVGGNTAATRNIISGNGGNGILITGRSFGAGPIARNNRVTGNYIGVNAAGNAAVSNNGDGVALQSGAFNNIIGAAGGAGNIVSGNARYGIAMEGAGTNSNTVQNNWVGLNAVGNGVLGNVAQGIVMHDGAQRNRIGGDAAGSGNVVAGNTHNGIGIGGVNGPTSGQNTAFNIVQGNYVGTDPTGKLTGFGNLLPGIAIAQGAHDNLIGGTTAGARNVVSGNKSDGIFLGFPDPNANRIQGNYIGVKADGSGALPNARNGILIADNARNNIIGGAGGRNIISGNAGAGIFIRGAATSNVVQSNYIGTNVTGTAALGNQSDGVQLRDSFNNVIGGNTAGTRNIISGNIAAGVAIIGATAKNNVVQGNYIGTNTTGTAAVPNRREGIFINALNNTVGGVATVPGTGAGNLISGNNFGGVHFGTVFGGSSDSNRVLGNSIGLNAAGNAALPNFHGVLIDGGAKKNSIGGAVAGTRNVISGNRQRGIYIGDAGTTGNRVEGNYIGTNLSGLAPIANQFDGVTLTFAASDNIIGGLTNTPGTGAGNVVSGNLISGISLEDGATNNFVYGNSIGVGSDGKTALPNRPGNQAGWGVLVESASSNTIGTTTTGANLIANNSGPGIQVLASRGAATGNRFRGNSVFKNGGLGIDLGANGVTTNDAGDGDGGANNLQNYPVLASASQAAADQPLILKGSLDSTAVRTFTIDAYANTDADLSGFGEGQTHLGSFVVGNGAFSKSLAVTGNQTDKVISLTATDNTSGDTSEFSRSILVTLPVAITVRVQPNPVTLNTGANQQFTATVGGTTNQNVTFSVDGGAASGTITATGLYTAPATPGTYTVRATSGADPTVSGTATVTVVRPPTGQPLLGWGYNQFGSVGDGSNTDRLSPVTVNIIQDARLIAAGGSHNLAVAGNVLYAWGDNDDYQLGDGTTISRNQPFTIALPAGIRADNLKAIACGWYHSLALTNDGRVLAWGYNKEGQCGVQADSPRFITAPRLVAGLSNITAIAGGTLHSLALDGNGKVWAWGNNFYGQLGNGSIENVNAIPTIVPNLPAAKAISAGAGHSVALLTNGAAQAWGWNFYGQLGNGLSGYTSAGEERRSAVPVVVRNIASGVQLSAGYAHNLVLKSDGTIGSWGNNFYGQLGRITPNANDALASSVTDNSGAVFGNVQSIVAGSGHNLVLRLDKTIWSWGYNEFGNLGLGTTNNQIAPQQVPNISSGQAIEAGYAHSIVIAKLGSTSASVARKQTTYVSGSAYVSNNSLTLTFSATLKSIAGGGLRVLVNNREVEVQSSSIGGNTLTILLPQGALHAGDEVIVSWSQLQTLAGESLIGNSPVLVVE